MAPWMDLETAGLSAEPKPMKICMSKVENEVLQRVKSKVVTELHASALGNTITFSCQLNDLPQLLADRGILRYNIADMMRNDIIKGREHTALTYLRSSKGAVVQDLSEESTSPYRHIVIEFPYKKRSNKTVAVSNPKFKSIW